MPHICRPITAQTMQGIDFIVSHTANLPLRSLLSLPVAVRATVLAMDPVAPRRGRLPIHLLVVSLTVLVALSVRSGAEVITLTEETFSDKVPPALLVSSSLPS